MSMPMLNPYLLIELVVDDVDAIYLDVFVVCRNFVLLLDDQC